jgi:hypothetical protein
MGIAPLDGGLTFCSYSFSDLESKGQVLEYIFSSRHIGPRYIFSLDLFANNNLTKHRTRSQKLNQHHVSNRPRNRGLERRLTLLGRNPCLGCPGLQGETEIRRQSHRHFLT